MQEPHKHTHGRNNKTKIKRIKTNLLLIIDQPKGKYQFDHYLNVELCISIILQ